MSETPITPKQALADYRWLRKNNFWHHFSLLEFTRSIWQPMYEEQLVYQLTTRMRFNRGSKPYALAEALREARAYHEAKDAGKSLREALRAPQGGVR